MSANRSSAIKHANIKNALFILIVAGLCFFLGCASPHGLILPSPWTFVAFSGNVKSFKSDDAAIVILNDTQPFFPRELVSADSLKKDIVLRSIYINGINSKVGSFRGDYLSGQRYHAFMLPSGEYSFSITTDYDVPDLYILNPAARANGQAISYSVHHFKATLKTVLLPKMTYKIGIDNIGITDSSASGVMIHRNLFCADPNANLARGIVYIDKMDFLMSVDSSESATQRRNKILSNARSVLTDAQSKKK